MIDLQRDALVFSFPEVHQEAKLTIDFQRTLRIPDDGMNYPLPLGWTGSPHGWWTTSPTGFRNLGSSTVAFCCQCTSQRRCGWISILISW